MIIAFLNAALSDPDPRVFQLALQDVLKVRSQSIRNPHDLDEVQQKLAELGYQLQVISVMGVS